jgi:hypothetical protein
LKFFDKNMNFNSEAGTFEVFIGGNSDTQNKKTFELID